MKQSLDLKLGQHLTITPQLQQAIRLLQLSSLELQQEIQEALENNPLLEELEEEAAVREQSEAPIEEAVTADSGSDDGEGGEGPAGDDQVLDRDAAIEDDSQREELTGSNDDWEDNSESLSASATRNEGGDGLPDIDARNSAPTTLREHLLWQMQMAIFSPTDRRIAEAVIDAINEDGYLTCSLEEIQQSLPGDLSVEIDEVQAVVHQIQNFDPAGVAARDLSECLLLQMRVLSPSTPHLDNARRVATREKMRGLPSTD